jgi:hypothetical protein
LFFCQFCLDDDFRTLVYQVLRNSHSYIQHQKLYEKGLQSILYLEEGVLGEIQCYGESIQVQVGILWSAHGHYISRNDSCSN